jgi:hypothetical protein
MLGHFWIQEYAGMAWSAGTIAAGLLYMAARIAVNAIRAKLHGAVKLHVVLACVNLWMAASMGLLLAIDKVVHFLPGFVLANVFAHAHLAALGWVTMMIVGVGYRMLPMLFPSKMPSGWSLYASAALLEIGVIGLFHSLLMRSRLAAAFGVTIALALAVFAGHVLWMRRHLVSKPAGAPRIDFGLLHAAGAGASLAASIALGLALLVRPASEGMLRAAAAYGVLGLVGFMSQMIVAMESRLLPMAAWLWAHAASGCGVTPTSPHAMRDPSLQAIAFAGWCAGVPALAAGMARASAPLVALGAWSLFLGVAVTALDSTFVLLRGLRRAGTP